MSRTQAYHKHFTRPFAATQNVVDIAVGMFPVKQSANNTTQIPDLGVPLLLKFCQRLPLAQPKHDSASLAIH
jgi:hypothetical protein